LEGFEEAASTPTTERYFELCKLAVHLFPLHLEEILLKAKQLDPLIETYREPLQQAQQEVLAIFELAYEKHLSFVKEKGISIENPLTITEIPTTIKKDVIEIIQESINCSEKQLKILETAFPKVVHLTTSFLREFLQQKLSRSTPPTSYSQLLALRTLQFSKDEIFYDGQPIPLYIRLIRNVEEALRIDNEDPSNLLTTTTIQTIFKALANCGEIAYYNNRFGYGAYSTECLFC